MVKKILVTGGSGFIGSNLVNHLLQKKYKVINLDKLSYSSTPDKFKKFTRDPNYKFIKVDLTNKKKIFTLLMKRSNKLNCLRKAPQRKKRLLLSRSE